MKVLKEKNTKKPNILFHKKDKDILSLLCQNARLSTSAIAKYLSLSRQSVEYRIKMIEKSHLIPGSIALINIKELGYSSFHFFFSLIGKDSEKTLIERSKESIYCNALLNYSGNPNYEISIMEKSASEAKIRFEEITKGLKIKSEPTILLKTITAKILPKYVSALNKNNLKDSTSFAKYFSLPKKEYKIDDKDRKILFMLSQDARLKLSGIASKIKLTEEAVSYRIKKLIQGNYILQFRPIIDFSVIGLSLVAFLISANNPEKKKGFENFLANNQNVLWAAETLGSSDYIIYLLIKDQEEINDFTGELSENFAEFVSSYDMMVGKSEYKYAFMTEAMSD